MAENVVSPSVCTFSDENIETLNIQIELPGVEKKNIDLNFYEDGFSIVAKKEDTKYMGSYAFFCPVQPDKALAKYSNGLLSINVPYKEPFQKGIKVEID
jgi:HSP20 family protein